MSLLKNSVPAAEEKFDMGPDLRGDLRFCRPYFLLPLLGSGGNFGPGLVAQPVDKPAAESESATEPALIHPNEIVTPGKAAGKATGETSSCSTSSCSIEERLSRWTSGHPVTDVVVLSHGWHRNFFSGVSAYDRLVSRFSLLFHSGRLALHEESLPKEPPRGKPVAEEQPDESVSPSPFRPLFLTLHWHSDPGEDKWVDTGGRRSKASFLQNAHSLFEQSPGTLTSLDAAASHAASASPAVLSAPATSPTPAASLKTSFSPEAAFVRDFELLFEFMAQMSAPGEDAICDDTLDARAAPVTQLLADYHLKVAPDASPPEKIAALWTCYHEAEPHGVHLDQAERPGRYLTPWKAASNLSRFLIGVLGLGFVLGPVLGFLQKFLPTPKEAWDWLWETGAALIDSPIGFLTRSLQGLWLDLISPLSGWIVLWLLLALVFLYVAAIYKKNRDAQVKEERRRRRADKAESIARAERAGDDYAGGMTTEQPVAEQPVAEQPVAKGAVNAVPGWLLALPWLYAQVLCTLPILAYGFFSYFFAGWLAPLFTAFNRLFGLHDASDERLGRRDNPPALSEVQEGDYVKGRLKKLRLKYYLAWLARLPLSLAQCASSEDGTLTRIAYQIDSYLAFFDMQGRGVEAGALAAMRLKAIFDANPSLHGARVHFVGHSFGGLVVCNAVRHLAHQDDFPGKPASLTLLQAAVSSNWFSGESTLRRKIRIIAGIYSRYDSANGFYYPVASVGRYAAGFVGLLEDGDFKPQQRGFYASLVRPPLLGVRLSPDGQAVVNLDASRLINGGTIASGGGHSLVFRDDVIHLLWAVIRLAWKDDKRMTREINR